MPKSFISLNNLTEAIAGMRIYDEYYNADDKKYKHALKILNKAMKDELTKKQYMCIYMKYKDNMSITSIAKALGVRPSTVSRHIKKAEQRLKKVVGYLLDTDEK